MLIHIQRGIYRKYSILRNNRLPFLLVFLFIGLLNLILLRLYLEYIQGIESTEGTESTEGNESESEGTDDSTPFLWGMQQSKDLGPSPQLDRMESLDTWIKFMSKDENLKNLKTKTLLVYEGGLARWGIQSPTSSRKLCTEKCIYLDGHDHDGDELIPKSDGVLVIRDWYYQSQVNVPNDKLKIITFLESPLASNGRFDSSNILVASYHRASDVVIPYGKWINKPLENLVSRSDKPTRNYAEGKTKLAAIFVSHCQVTNHRMQYVNKLKEHVTVDVYGRCGDHHCPRSKEKECFEKLNKDYKFYLAFENANCRDYITEKHFNNALENDIVPVVLGAHPNDYKAMSPPHSFIHVEDFASPKLLADYLKMLDKNDKLYNEYFAWKTKSQAFRPPSFAGTLCRMCAMLHYAEYTKSMPPSRVGQNWASFDHCLRPGEWYWERNASDVSN